MPFWDGIFMHSICMIFPLFSQNASHLERNGDDVSSLKNMLYFQDRRKRKWRKNSRFFQTFVSYKREEKNSSKNF